MDLKAMKNQIIEVSGARIAITQQLGDDYISLTDIANAREDNARAADVIKNWLRNRGTLEFIGTWEQLYNPNFKVVEFDHFRMQAGLPTFVLIAKQWIEKPPALGIYIMERIKQLSGIAIVQMTSLLSIGDLQKGLEKKND